MMQYLRHTGFVNNGVQQRGQSSDQQFVYTEMI